MVLPILFLLGVVLLWRAPRVVQWGCGLLLLPAGLLFGVSAALAVLARLTGQ